MQLHFILMTSELCLKYSSVLSNGNGVFPKIDDNKGLSRELQHKFSTKVTSSGYRTWDPRTPLVGHLVLHSHALLTELT